MTSASELFHNRRYRFGRNADGLGFDSLSDRSTIQLYSNNRRHHQHQQGHGNRHDAVGDGADSPRRSSYIRQHCHRVSHPDHGSARFGQASSRSHTGNSVYPENSSNISSQILTQNDRLPGTVLLARARLLERLRGVSYSANRKKLGSVAYALQVTTVMDCDLIDCPRSIFNTIQCLRSVRAPPDMENLRLVGSGDWVTEISPSIARGSTSVHLSSNMERMHLFVQEVTKRPPGLTQEVGDSLHFEVFGNSMIKIEGLEPRVLQDCSICLENFMDGEELIRLPCEHRFHSACLNPWLRCSGDCPYCRRAVCSK